MEILSGKELTNPPEVSFELLLKYTVSGDLTKISFGKHNGVRIELKEIGYKSILIGGMSAGITR